MASKLFVCLAILLILPCICDVCGEPVYSPLLKPLEQYHLPVTEYELDAFEPHIDAKTMDVHIFGHHDAYKNKTNSALLEWRANEPDNDFARKSILRILQNLEKVPEKYRTHMRNYGGGFVNHCFYFGVMSPNEDKTERTPTGELLEDINDAFGSLQNLKDQFKAEALKLFGSGYVWLSRKPGAPRPNLRIHTTANQDSPVSEGLHPLVTLDLWEHAYYLHHNYRRARHLADFWMVLDWQSVAALDAWWRNLDQEEERVIQEVEGHRRMLANKRAEAEKEQAEKQAKTREQNKKANEEL